MDKRQFLKTSAAIAAGALLPRQIVGQPETAPTTNWAGNYRFHAAKVASPETSQQVAHIVTQSDRLRVVGSRHSFNGIADSTQCQIYLKHLDSMVLQPEEKSVTIGAGVTYDQLAPYLDKNGFALHNLASLTEITVAGAVVTGTHGSGSHNGNLATPVSAVEFIAADGETIVLSRKHNREKFAGAVVSLGALGVITRLTLDVQPRFLVSQVVYENLSMDRLEHHMEEIFSSGYSVSLFTDWQHHRIGQVWIKKRVDASPHDFPPEFYGATLAKQKLHPLPGHSAESCTEQLGVPGPWYERLPHFKIGFTPSNGAELQTEYFVPRDKGYEAMLAVEELRDLITPHLFISELRTVDRDELWMSPCFERPAMTIHFTWKFDSAAVLNVLPKIEEKLAPFQARPHWAKLFTMSSSQIGPRYPKVTAYKELLSQYDPKEKFRNQFINAKLFGG
jgi:xylitol oxidase